MPKPRRVLAIAFEGCQTLDLAGPCEVFGEANSVSGQALYEVIVASRSGESVGSSSGLGLATRALRGLWPRAEDTILISGGKHEAIRAEIASGEPVAWIERAAALGCRIASVCSGALLLGATKRYAGYRIATHWAACDVLAAQRPDIHVERDAIFVEDRGLWSSAGVSTGIDMALAMVEADHGRALVDQVAAMLVLYVRRPGFQSQWSSALVAQAGASLREIVDWARAHLDVELSVPSLAKRAAMSPRSFHRRCVAELGTTPARVVAKLRVERARTLLATSPRTAKQIAVHCGLRDGAQLARLIRRDLGVSPREYRAMFARAAP